MLVETDFRLDVRFFCVAVDVVGYTALDSQSFDKTFGFRKLATARFLFFFNANCRTNITERFGNSN